MVCSLKLLNLSFGTSKTIVNSYYMDNVELERKHSFNGLDTLVCDNMSWDRHIDSASKKQTRGWV